MAPLRHAAAAMGRRGLDALRRYTLPHHRPTSFSPTASTSASTDAARFGLNDNRGADATTLLSHHHHSFSTHGHTAQQQQQQQQQRCHSSSSAASPAPTPQPPIDVTTEATQGKGDVENKSIFSKLWDQYSIEGQKKRIEMGERLFRSAQYRANDPRWFTEGRIPYEFRPRHALLTMHIWFIHKRLIADRVDSHLALLVQEELFDILWHDTRARIRAEGVNELTVNKHLKDAQQLTFLQCTHYDHCFQEFATDDDKRLDEIAGVNWLYVLTKDEEAYNDQLERLTMYVEYQHINLSEGVPDKYFWEGRIPWGDMPDFSDMKDNTGKDLVEMGDVSGLEVLPKNWVKMLTDAGEPYYWNTDTNHTSWKSPS